MTKKQKRLGEMLLGEGLISQSQLQRALKRQRQWGGRLGSNLVMTGAIRDCDLRRFLAVQTGTHEVDISEIEILPHILKKIPQKVAEQYCMVPIALKAENVLQVACADPTDERAIETVTRIAGHPLEPYITSYSSILRAIHRCYLGIRVPDGPTEASVPPTSERQPYLNGNCGDMVPRAELADLQRRFDALLRLLEDKGLVTDEELNRALSAPPETQPPRGSRS